MHPLYISAITLSCAAGNGLKALGRALAENRSGLRRNDFPHCDLDTWIGRVDQVEDVDLQGELAAYQCRNNQLALLALEQDDFTAQVAKLQQRVDPSRIACVLGTSTAGIGVTEAGYRTLGAAERFADPYRLPRVHTPHTSSAFVAQVLGLKGPIITVSTACSSSAKVFSSAARLIHMGWADAAVVGGVDSLCLSILYGFHSLELISNTPCQPFDRQRSGLNLGEAAGFAILEKTADEAWGRLLGWGESSDAHHMASPHPDGIGAIAAMRQALHHAKLQPEEIEFINCHGTATAINDRIEAAAIKHVFATPPPSASTKGWTGHTLGAAGITEAVLSMLTLNNQYLPTTLNCREPEDEWADFILLTPRPAVINRVLSNSFGFGGSNCTLVLGW